MCFASISTVSFDPIKQNIYEVSAMYCNRTSGGQVRTWESYSGIPRRCVHFVNLHWNVAEPLCGKGKIERFNFAENEIGCGCAIRK